MKKLYKLLLLANLILFTSCGFHLRGVVSSEMPPWFNNVAIIVNKAHADLKTRLIEQLQGFYITVCPISNNAEYFIILESDEYLSNISSVSSTTTPRQYQLIYTLWFKLQNSHYKDIIPLNPISVSRTVTINNDRILGSSQEEEQTKSSMRRDAVLQIINTLRKQHSKPPTHDH